MRPDQQVLYNLAKNSSHNTIKSDVDSGRTTPCDILTGLFGIIFGWDSIDPERHGTLDDG
jgi:hypothetical protein